MPPRSGHGTIVSCRANGTPLMFALFRQRNYAFFWSAGLVTNIGDWALGVGLPIYIYMLTHSVLATGTMLFCGRAPRILIGPIAGVLVDRWSRKRTLVVVNVLLAMAVLPLILVRAPSLVWIVYLQCLVQSALDTFIGPAAGSLMPSLVGKEQLAHANLAGAVSENLSRLIGPALGGVAIVKLGLTGLVLLDAASFLGAALLTGLVAVPVDKPVENDAAQIGAMARAWSDWRDGLRVLTREETLRVLLVAFAITSLGEGIGAVLFPVFVYQRLHGGPEQLSILAVSQAIGSLIGAVFIAVRGARVLARGAVGGSSIVFGGMWFAMLALSRASTSLTPQVALFIVAGLAAMCLMTGFGALTQLRSPDGFRGRINSTMFTSAALVRLCGVALASFITDRVGLVAMLSVDGIGYVLAGLTVLAFLPTARADHS